ncbi:hypothetical protein K443DRAFT_12582 [Laccaria amethystina LaAM-08-1]|uniref:Uncharacterized protein n=1 Tax=Laccaria amethystina LaAM-08-1 TaxID=1095629 RepID=A0A0C9X874_9AGAR|nr:hypothetical protein K443DRAFT_12582 [Laccaria amethystina LaAM-08-1]
MSNDRLLTSITKLNGKNYHDWKFAFSDAGKNARKTFRYIEGGSWLNFTQV